MENFLSEEKRLLLVAAHAATSDKTIADRLKVVLLYNKGYTHQQIADVLFININTSTKHLDDYLKRNKLDKESGGKAPKLNLKQSEQLITYLNANLCTKVQEIILVCKVMFNIEYKKTGMIAWLHRHNFTYKKPPKILPHVSPEIQQDFIKLYNELKKKVEFSQGKEVLLHMDSVHPNMNLKTSYGWINKNNPIQLVVKASSTRVNIAGAIELATMNIVARQYKTIDSDNIIEFLKELNIIYSNSTINIVLDNGRYHKTLEVENYCKNNNIILHFLPKYSPNLNPIERVWKVMNKYVRNNTVFDKPKEFRDKLDNFFNKTWNIISNEIKSEVNDNFHILNLGFKT